MSTIRTTRHTGPDAQPEASHAVAAEARTTAVWHIERTDVGRLVSRIFDQGRTTPLVLISAASDTGTPRVDPRRFEGRIRAILAVLDSPETARTLTDTLGEAFRAYGGAVRVIWPRASSRDHWRRHRLFFTYPDDDPDETIDRIVEYVRDHARSAAAASEAAVAPARTPARAEPPLPTGVTPRLLDRKRAEDPPVEPLADTAPTTADAIAEPSAEPSAGHTTRLDAEPAADLGSGSSPTPPGGSAGTPAMGVRGVGAAPAVDLGPALGEGLEGPPEPLALPAPVDHSSARRVGPGGRTEEQAGNDVSTSGHGPVLAGASVAQVEAIVARTVREQVQDVITEMLGGPGGSDETDRERSRADALEQELEDLRRRHDATLTELASRRIERDLSSFRVHSDPAEQLRWEICTAWLLATPEDARGEGPRPFRFGPDFITSLDAHIIDRAKVVAVCAEVLNRTVHERRTTHPAREGGGGAKPRTRPDASTAWRVYLANKTAGAPRLMFWELKDGGVEFAVAAHHDRFDFD